MEKMDLIFKQATIEHINDIMEINNSYLEPKNDQGLIITKYEMPQLRKYILNNPKSISIATITDNIIVGFIVISFFLEIEVIKKLCWYSENLENMFKKRKKLYIEKVAVRKGYQRKKIGLFMYESIFSKYPEWLFYSFIVKKPFNNIVSLNFHKRMGFIEAARFKAKKFMGINNYESAMLMKL